MISRSILHILIFGLIAVSAVPIIDYTHKEPIASNLTGDSATKVKDEVYNISEEEFGKIGGSCGLPGNAEQSTLILTGLSISGLLYLARKNK